jgi:hypothetical protein
LASRNRNAGAGVYIPNFESGNRNGNPRWGNPDVQHRKSQNPGISTRDGEFKPELTESRFGNRDGKFQTGTENPG